MEAVASPLAAWESFYVIIGSASATLTGLQFVMIVLSAEMNALGSGAATRAFATPTIVHFCAALFISALLSAPWSALSSPGIALAAGGVAGLVYAVLVVRQASRQTDYMPVLADWIWHGALPLIAYAALLGAAVLLQRDPISSLFVIGGTALLLLFVGIHNAWDSVLYIALLQRQPAGESGDQN